MTPGVQQVDIIRDVAILAHTHFSASLFSLPLKTVDNPHGVFTEQELSQILSICFFAIFYDINPVGSFALKNGARTLARTLGSLVYFNVESVAKLGFIKEFVERLHKRSELTEYGTHMIQRLLESGLSVKDVVWGQLMPTASSMVANQAQLFGQVVDYYFTVGKEHLPAMRKLAFEDTDEADEVLLH
jgi:linoleate 8R-lipoxygenase/9,12-octadecadienoate 8-hydroperoxide 8R-isomerase